MGDFLDDFYAADNRQRPALFAEPPAQPPDRRWAAYLAAAIEVLCARYDLPVPEWTQRPAYFLDRAWFVWDGARMLSLLDTPCPFARHGVFADSRILSRT